MQGKCTAKADIYSLGIVLWEIVTQVWPPYMFVSDI